MSTHRHQPAYSAGRMQYASSSRQRYGSAGQAEVIHDEETFEELSIRQRAAEYLDSTEMLMWLAGLRNESVSQTRHHYERVMAGFKPDRNAVEWEDVYEPTDSDIERLKPRSSSSRAAATAAAAAAAAAGAASGASARARSSGSSTPVIAGPSRTDGSGGVSKKRRSGEGGTRKRRSGTGGGG